MQLENADEVASNGFIVNEIGRISNRNIIHYKIEMHLQIYIQGFIILKYYGLGGGGGLTAKGTGTGENKMGRGKE